MAINFRHIKGSALTHAEMDSNLGSYFHSASISVNDDSGSTITLFRSESNGSSLTLTTASIIIVSSSYALTASYADNGGSVDYISNVNLDGSNLRITGSNNAFDGVIDLSTISVTSSSYANNASTADSSTSSSYANNASTADSSTSSSYAVTASYATNAGAGVGFPYTGSAEITGSLAVIGGGITGSLLGTASHAISASHETTYELSSSHAENADSSISSSYASTSPIQSNGLTVNGTGADGFLYINGNAATTNPTNVQGMAFAYNDDGGNRASMIYYNPGTVTSAENASYYFGIENEFIDSASIVAGNTVEQSKTSSLNLKMYGNGMIDLVGAYPTIGNTQWRLPVVSGSAGQVLKYPSSGILLEWGNSSDLTGLNLISGSGQIDGLGFLQTGSLTSSLDSLGYLDKTASRLDIQDFLTGSLSDVITGSSLDLISGSGQIDGLGFLLTGSLGDKIDGLGKNFFTGSGQLPGGLISGSGQLGDLNFLNKTESRLDIQDFLTGSLSDVITGSSLSLLSGSDQISDLGYLTGLGGGLISGSGQISDLGYLSGLGTGLISGSGQIGGLGYLLTSSLGDKIDGLGKNFFTGSGQLPGGLISGSGQLPADLISGSGQLNDLNFLNKSDSRLDIDDYLTGSLGSIIGNSTLTLFSGSGQLPAGLFSGSGQLPTGLFSGSFGDLAPTGLLSGSGQLTDLNFLDKSDSRLDIDDYLTGSLGAIISHSALALFSGSSQVSFTGIGSKPSGLVSGSAQVSFTGLDNIPSDIVSGSVIRSLPSDLVSGSSQISFTNIGSKPSGLISGSGQLPTGLVSGSSQVSFASIGSKPTGLVSGSGQVSFTGLGNIPADIVSGSVIRELPSDLVSASAQISFTNIGSKPTGLVSGSSQVSFASIGSKPSGLVSGSSQVSFASIGSKPSGLVSGSGQVSFTGLDNIPSDIVSGSVVRSLPSDLVSASAQISFASISSKPTGLVSASGQISYSSISSLPTLFDGDYDSLSSKPTLFDGTYASLSSKPALISGGAQITFGDIPSLPTFITGSAQITDLGFTGDYTHPNHSGDVTSAGDGATTIAANKVTHAKYQQIATDTIIGRTASGTGNVTALTAAEVRAILNVANGATANTGDITAVTAGSGMSGGATSGAATVTLGDPSTLTAATTNGTTATSHTHTITTTDDGTASTIVATDANGEISAANFNTTSDKRLKSNIEPIKEGLEVIKKFVSYEYELNGKQDAGFIAQEVQEVLPYAVQEKSDGYLGMNNKPVLAHLHKAILELDQRLTDIENKIG